VTITVTTQSGCTWSAAESPSVSWGSITSGSARTGSGTFTLQVLANAQPSARTMGVTVAGSLVTLTQSGNALTTPLGLRVIR
jgi:hypothetical protein